MLFNNLIIFYLLLISYPKRYSSDEAKDITTDEFENTCVNQINIYRELHNAKPLTLNRELEEYAKNRCLKLSDIKYYNESFVALDNDIGELRFVNKWAETKDYTCRRVVNEWYKLNRFFNYTSSTPLAPFKTKNKYTFNGLQSFAQLVWKKTTSIGCAKCTIHISVTRYDATTYVCEFKPRGNIAGEYGYVGRPH
ncbi:uncharacterized protein LOC128957206 [Oppia nitens]|uniref:uncharacterized protein LOC128957206 n=1 Tax=Oppia nitens TaxID=1686743 RepID=UPI0023DA3AE0|nr:uncharacterized protein LOC128957206 [Oppia nitens]